MLFMQWLEAIEVSDRTARGSGRTERLLQTLNPGDLFVVATNGEVNTIRQRLQRMGKNGVHVCTLTHMSERSPGIQRVVMDHGAEKQLILDEVRSVTRFLSSFQPRPKISPAEDLKEGGYEKW